MSLINIELIECLALYVLLFGCFLGVLACIFVLLSILLEFTHKIFVISKEYYSYIRYRHDLDYIIYLQDKAEKYNSKEYSKKALRLSKMNEKQGE